MAMKQQTGWAAALVVALAATVGISSFQTKAPASSGDGKEATVTSASAKALENAIEQGPCADIESRLQSFFLTDPKDVVAPPSCYQEDAPPLDAKANAASTVLGEKTAGLHFIIATLPDPLHTHLSLIFDRAMEAIQQAAQDEGYLYDSSWLPWETAADPSYSRLEDRDKAEERTKRREDQPGVLLFRARANENEPNSSRAFLDGLVVFIVGEEPTGGIHRRQFENAAAWVSTLQTKHLGNALNNPVQIVGPSFSGSLPSLEELLPSVADKLKPGPSDSDQPMLQIFSGNVTSDAEVSRFQYLAKFGSLSSLHLQFRSFQQSDEITIDRYCGYLIASGADLGRLAILSEDETAFGYQKYSEDFSCSPKPLHPRPTRLYYPRDISALRAAYQNQSIFSRSAPQTSVDTVRRTLQTDIADPQGKQHDTVRNYSGDQTALSQESAMQQIVSMMRAHRSQYILIRSSNPLDQLFLGHFLKMAYPEGRVVILGADLLQRREIGASGLNGIMTLSTYPLLPWASDWTNLAYQSGRHAHRVFTHDGAEGTYVATRFLLHRQPSAIPIPDLIWKELPDEPKYRSDGSFLPLLCRAVDDIRDYSPPFWVDKETASGCGQPPVWLSVLGNGGFWPVTALDYVTLAPSDVEERGHRPSAAFRRVLKRVARAFQSIGDSVYFCLWPTKAAIAGGDPYRWLDMPLSMKLTLVAVLFWAIFHLFCCARPSVTVKPGHRAHFVRIPGLTHPSLLLFGSVLIALIPIVLGWGYGEMSMSGEPLPDPWPYRLFLPLIWMLAGSALCANVWIEHYLEVRGDKNNSRPKPMTITQKVRVWIDWIKAWSRRIPEIFRVIWRTLTVYLVITFILYFLIDFMLEGALRDDNRIPTYWRSINLTSGVSPLFPLIALTLGLYLWFWHALQGLALFHADRPLLPTLNELKIARPGREPDDLLRWLSREAVAEPLEELCTPLPRSVLIVAILTFVVVFLVGSLTFGGFPIRSLGSTSYSWVFCVWLTIGISVAMANAWQLLRVWLKLRDLLMSLDRLPLRRTLDELKGYSWGSIWRMSGNVLDMRYRFVFRQLESLTHLHSTLFALKLQTTPQTLPSTVWQRLQRCFAQARISAERTGPHDNDIDDVSLNRWIKRIDRTRKARIKFARWYSKHWDDWTARSRGKLIRVQVHLAATAGMLLTEVLMPAWRREERSLILQSRGNGDGLSKSNSSSKSTTADGEHSASNCITPLVRNAEELVCLVYLGFIQNILGRMRSLAFGIIWIFIAIALAVSSYPFDPKPVLSAAIIILFILLGTVVVTVYAQMHRDATLSRLTETKPGELGSEFWVKLIGIGIGPVIGLLATVFPEFTQFLFSWLQPGLASMK
jgi:hypothetical protein